MPKQTKLLVVCGPTATGKTKLALYLARKFKGELISADSRQVYRGMDIGTGKDLPENAKWQMLNAKLGYYLIDGVRIWGYDLVDPKETFNVADYLKFVWPLIPRLWKENKLPILVGGTGFYIKAAVYGIDTLNIPEDRVLRASLGEKSSDELFETLSNLDPIKAGSLNRPDKKNPRRLLRAIEIAASGFEKKGQDEKPKFDTLFIGLKLDREVLAKRIAERVEKRVSEGIEREIENLLKNEVGWGSQALSGLGYRQWRAYFENKNLQTKTSAIEDWKREEVKYASRQKLWFKRDKRINWFDVSYNSFLENVEKLVKNWYYNK